MVDSYDTDELSDRLAHAGEAVQMIWNVLDDFLSAFDIDREPYEDDLARIQELVGLIG